MSDTSTIPGVPPLELEVMTASAQRLLGDGATIAAGELASLAEPADRQAAGRASRSRDTYNKGNGVHFMVMPHRAC